MSTSAPPPLPHIAQLHAYTPGLQPTEPGWVKLNTNECPYAPSPRVAEAIRQELASDGASLRLYPNPKSSPLRVAVAKLHGHGLREENVCIGNGSDDILNLLVRAYGAGAPRSAADAANGAIGFTLPSYSLYPVLVAIQDGRAQTLAFDRTMQLPLAQIAASPASAFFLTSPNAPTGVGFARDELEQAVKSFRGLFVIDEAYAPFARQDAVPLLAKYPNLVITRTLSKAYALAGIRVGYALAQPEVIDVLDRVRDSYNINRLSQAAALAALNDADYYTGVITKVKETRDHYLEEWRDQRGWFTYRSQANFIFTEPKNARGETGPAVAKSAYDFLYAHKVLVRYFPSHPLTASFLRISVGTDDEMLVLDEKLHTWLKHA
jgi:histidinol-phosphate aminotransferase